MNPTRLILWNQGTHMSSHSDNPWFMWMWKRSLWSHNHRTIQKFRLEIIWSRQGLTLLLAQRFTWLSSEYLQGWRFHILSGQLAPVFNHRYSNFFLCISIKNFATYVCHLLSFLCAPLRRFFVFFIHLIISDLKSTAKTLPLGHK